MMLTHYVAIDDSHGNAGSDWLLEAGVSPAGRTNLLTHARVTNKTAEVQLLEVAEKSSSPFKGVAKAYFHAVGIVGKILICLPLAWLLITIACSFGRDWETQYRRLCICWLVFLGGAFAYGVFALLNKQITVISFIVYVLIILVVAFLVWTRMKKVEKGLYDAILESTTRSRRKFQIIRQIREECEKQKRAPEIKDFKAAEAKYGLLEEQGEYVSISHYFEETTDRAKYWDELVKSVKHYLRKTYHGFPDNDPRDWTKRSSQALFVIFYACESDISYELLGVVSRLLLRVASAAAVIAMMVMLVTGFKEIYSAFSASDHSTEAAETAEQHDERPLKLSIKALEYLLLAALPYLLLVSLTRYVYSVSSKDPDAGATPFEIKQELAEVKAFWVALLIGVLAASLIGQVLDTNRLKDPPEQYRALVICLVMALLIGYFAILEHTASKEEKGDGLEKDWRFSGQGSLAGKAWSALLKLGAVKQEEEPEKGHQNTSREEFEAQVMAVESDDIHINRGAASGLRQNDVLVVYVAREIKNSTGKTVAWGAGNRAGRIRLFEVKDHRSVGKAEHVELPIAEDMLVRFGSDKPQT